MINSYCCTIFYSFRNTKDKHQHGDTEDEFRRDSPALSSDIGVSSLKRETHTLSPPHEDCGASTRQCEDDSTDSKYSVRLHGSAPDTFKQVFSG